MPSLESAVAWAEAVAADPSYGYSQGDRDGGSFDCSSLVCRALRAAGFGTPSPSFNTRTMGAWLESHGWAWHAGTSGVRRGDVLWKTGHTGIAASGSTVVEARVDERGGITGGRPGDQTGREIGVFAIASMAWAGYWRHEAGDEPGDEEDDMTDAQARQLQEIHDWISSRGPNQLTRTDSAGHDNPGGHDFYGRLQIIEFNLSLVMARLGIEDWYRGHPGEVGMEHPTYEGEVAKMADSEPVGELAEAVADLAEAVREM